MAERTKRLDFDRRTKLAIMERDKVKDWPCCVYCGAAAPTDTSPVWSNAHFISRAQGGKGILENGLTLCPRCHRVYDQTEARGKMREYFRGYLRQMHPGWNEEMLYYGRD